MTRAPAPRGARRVLLGPLWQWAIIVIVVAPLPLALAAWAGAFNAEAESIARDALRIWALVLFGASLIWLALVVPGVVLSTITARRRGTPGLVGQGASLFWFGTFLVCTALAGSIVVWVGVEVW